MKTGDYVEEGQLLCEIDTKQVDAAKLQLVSRTASVTAKFTVFVPSLEITHKGLLWLAKRRLNRRDSV